MKNLIYVNAGKNSQHKSWYVEGREYDIFANYYEGDNISMFEETDMDCGYYKHQFEDYKMYYQGFKFQCFYNIMMNGHLYLLDKYDYFWITDNDMGDMDYKKINRMFSLFKESGLYIGQPSTRPEDPAVWSYYLNHREGQRWRETTFVEIMCPLFTKEALINFLPFFKESASGCGLDLLWSDYARRNGKQVGVIDEIIVKHLIECGGIYPNLAKVNIDPRTEMEAILNKYQVRWPHPI
jgi:hypothetical protein